MAKILFFQTNGGRHNGIAAYIRELTTRLQGADECHVLAFAPEAERAALARDYAIPPTNMLLLRPGSERAVGARQMTWVAAEIRRRGIEVVHDHALRAATLVAALRVFWRVQVACVYTNHGLRYRQPLPAWRRAVAYCAEAAVTRLHQAVVCLTERDLAEARASGAVPQANSHVVRTRIDVAAPDQASLTGPAGVICVGPVGQQKGTDRFIEIARRARLLQPGLAFRWLGGNALNAERTNDVEWLGQLNHQQVVRHLASSALYLFCSRIDTYPLAILEAYAVGLPVVFLSDCDHGAYTAPGMPQFSVAQSDEAAKAIVRLAQAPAERQRLSETARHWFRENAAGADRWAADYRHIFETVRRDS